MLSVLINEMMNEPKLPSRQDHFKVDKDKLYSLCSKPSSS